MKKVLGILLLAVVLLPAVFGLSIAGPYYNAGSEGQYYAVSFDEEGEATVVAKFVLTNYNKETLRDVRIELPGEGVRLINSVQEWYGTREECIKYAPNGTCLEYGEYPDYQAKYAVLEPEVTTLSDAVVLDFELEVPVESQDQAVILLYYKADGFVTEKGSVYEFDFETAKVPFDLQTTRVSITASGDLYLEGGESQTDYRESSVAGAAPKAFAADAAVESRALQDLSSSVQWAPGYVKTATGLDPLESFHVEGRYAASWWNLNIGKVAGITLAVLVVLALIIVGIWKLVSSGPKNGSWGVLLVASLISAVVLLLLVIFSWLLVSKLGSAFGYQYSGIFVFSYMILAFLVGLFILVGPGVYFGARFGIAKGLAVIGFTLLFLVVLGAIVGLFFGLWFQVSTPEPYYGVAERAVY